MVYDPVRRSMVLVFGMLNSSGTFFSEQWELADLALDVNRVLSVDEIVELGRVASDGRAATTFTDEVVQEAAGAGCR